MILPYPRAVQPPTHLRRPRQLRRLIAALGLVAAVSAAIPALAGERRARRPAATRLPAIQNPVGTVGTASSGGQSACPDMERRASGQSGHAHWRNHLSRHVPTCALSCRDRKSPAFPGLSRPSRPQIAIPRAAAAPAARSCTGPRRTQSSSPTARPSACAAATARSNACSRPAQNRAK